MRIGDLAQRSSVPLPTVKYYLRAGLLPPGVATAANQADYGDRHLHRLHLLFVLLDVGGMSVAGARATLDAIEDSDVSLRHLLVLITDLKVTSRLRGLHQAEHDALREQLSGVLAGHGVSVVPGAPPLERLIAAYAAARRVELPGLEPALDRYADAAAGFVACDSAVLRAIAHPPHPAGARPVEVREAVVIVAVLARVIQEALCDLARQEWLPEAVAERP
jgi:DNA-binding transcriptional MerR regulator